MRAATLRSVKRMANLKYSVSPLDSSPGRLHRRPGGIAVRRRENQMKLSSAVVLSALLCCAAFAGSEDDHSKLFGVWQGQSASAEKWVIQDKGEKVRLS